MQLSQVCQHRGGKEGPDIHEQSHGLLTFCRISTVLLVQLTIIWSLLKLLNYFWKTGRSSLKNSLLSGPNFYFVFPKELRAVAKGSGVKHH